MHAWIDLLILASFEDRFFFLRGIKIEQKRGQVAESLDFFFLLWKWSRGKVIRYLKFLEKEGQIELQKSNVINLISITNYNKYQPNRTTNRTTNGTTNRTTNGTTNRTTYKESNKESNKEILLLQKIYKKVASDFFTHTLKINLIFEKDNAEKYLFAICEKIKQQPTTNENNATTELKNFLEKANKISWIKNFDFNFLNENFQKILIQINREDKIEEQNKQPRATKFVPPTLEEVKKYCEENNKKIDAERFFNFYESKNWYIGKNKMKKWHSAIATWERSEEINNNYNNGKNGRIDTTGINGSLSGQKAEDFITSF